jgi:hypothetical protein
VLTGLTLIGVVFGSRVTIQDELSFLADGTDIELEFETPGTYEVEITHRKYLRATLQVVVP